MLEELLLYKMQKRDRDDSDNPLKVACHRCNNSFLPTLKYRSFTLKAERVPSTTAPPSNSWSPFASSQSPAENLKANIPGSPKNIPKSLNPPKISQLYESSSNRNSWDLYRGEDEGVNKSIDVGKTSAMRDDDASRTGELRGVTDVMDVEHEGDLNTAGAVIYMTPVTVRGLLDQVLLDHGESALRMSWIRSNYPAIFWNLLWYTTRFQMPLPLIHDIEPKENSSSSQESELDQHSQVDETRPLFPEVGYIPCVARWQEHIVHIQCLEVQQRWGEGTSMYGRGAWTPTSEDAVLDFPPLEISRLFPCAFTKHSKIIANLKRTLTEVNSTNLENAISSATLTFLKLIKSVHQDRINSGDIPNSGGSIEFVKDTGGFNLEALELYSVLLRIISHYDSTGSVVAPITSNHSYFDNSYMRAVGKFNPSFLNKNYGDIGVNTEGKLTSQPPKTLIINFRHIFGYVY